MRKSNSRRVAILSATVAVTVATLAALSCETARAGDDPFASDDDSSGKKPAQSTSADATSPTKLVPPASAANATKPGALVETAMPALDPVSSPATGTGAISASETKRVAKAPLEPLPPGDPLEVGFDLLKKLDYERALAAFNIAARANPTAAEPHFGRAKALLGLQRRDEALKEFKLCTFLDSSTANAEKCNKEIEYYTSKPPVGAPLTVTSEDIEKSSTRITNQASTRINQIRTDAYSRGTGFSRAYSSRTKNGTYSIPIPSMSSSLSLNGAGGGISARDYMIKNGSMRGYDSRAYNRSRAKDAAAKAEDARRRAEAVRDAAIGLSRAMSTKPSDSSGIYLSPHGTNLYVRNYVNFDPVRPEPAPAEALSAKQGIIDASASESKPAVPNSLTSAPGSASTSLPTTTSNNSSALSGTSTSSSPTASRTPAPPEADPQLPSLDGLTGPTKSTPKRPSSK